MTLGDPPHLATHDQVAILQNLGVSAVRALISYRLALSPRVQIMLTGETPKRCRRKLRTSCHLMRRFRSSFSTSHSRRLLKLSAFVGRLRVALHQRSARSRGNWYAEWSAQAFHTLHSLLQIQMKKDSAQVGATTSGLTTSSSGGFASCFQRLPLCALPQRRAGRRT